MGRLFGTDGVRGVANNELTCEMAFNIGRAAAYVLTKETRHKPKILIGKDTRISGDMLEAALSAGLCSVGAKVVSLGVIPTPAVAYLTRKYEADAGIVISASHNSAEYNGIKIFNSNGYKLSDSIEERIESIILDDSEKIELPTGDDVGTITKCDTAVADYVEFAKSTKTPSTTIIISTGKYEVMDIFSLLVEKRFIKPPVYPMLAIIPSNGSKNEIRISPIKKDKIIIKVGSKTEMK